MAEISLCAEDMLRVAAAGLERQQADDLDGAEELFRVITEVVPDGVLGWQNLAVVAQLKALRDGTEAFAGKELLERALQCRRLPELLNDIGNCLMYNELRYEDALPLYREAAIRHKSKKAAFHLAVCALQAANITGDPALWREAWDWNEWRPQKEDLGDLEYRGEDVAGKKIVVKFEQGLGDYIWALRFCRDLSDRGACVYAHCNAHLARLASRQTYIARVLDSALPCEIATDYVVQSMSLPAYLLPDGPQQVDGYVTTGRMVKIKGLVPKRDGQLRVGLCWKSSTEGSYQGWRNVPQEMLKRVVDARPDIDWVSLQFASGDGGLGISTAGIDECRDLFDTACLIETCDLVISCDTVIPHLAAALDVPVWLMDRWSSSWQWTPEGSRWYRRVNTHRQPARGEWEPVIDLIARRIHTV